VPTPSKPTMPSTAYSNRWHKVEKAKAAWAGKGPLNTRKEVRNSSSHTSNRFHS